MFHEILRIKRLRDAILQIARTALSEYHVYVIETRSRTYVTHLKFTNRKEAKECFERFKKLYS